MTELRFRVWLASTALIAAAALVLAGWALYTRFQQSNAARAANQMVWHAVICQIEAAVVKEPGLTAGKRDQALRFYDSLLIQDVQTAGCGLR